MAFKGKIGQKRLFSSDLRLKCHKRPKFFFVHQKKFWALIRSQRLLGKKGDKVMHKRPILRPKTQFFSKFWEAPDAKGIHILAEKQHLLKKIFNNFLAFHFAEIPRKFDFHTTICRGAISFAGLRSTNLHCLCFGSPCYSCVEI